VNIVGWSLLAVGLLIYLGAIVTAIWRIFRMYSSAMSGRAGLFLATALATTGRFWPFLGVAIAGAALLLTHK
jgi:hypothetical protein